MGRLFKKNALPTPDASAASTEPPPFNRAETLQLARTQVEQGQFDEAEKSFKKILSEDTNDVEGLFGLGSVFQAKGFRQQAIMTYNRVLVVKPGDPEAKKRLSELMKSGG